MVYVRGGGGSDFKVFGTWYLYLSLPKCVLETGDVDVRFTYPKSSPIATQTPERAPKPIVKAV